MQGDEEGKKVVKTPSLAKLVASMERFLIVHGQVVLHCIHGHYKKTFRESAFVSGLKLSMASRGHTVLKVSKKKGGAVRGGGGGRGVQCQPAASLRPDATKRKPMRATTTRLIDTIWKGYFEKHGLEKGDAGAAKGQAGKAGGKGKGEGVLGKRGAWRRRGEDKSEGERGGGGGRGGRRGAQG